MSLLNQNWINLDGHPVTGRVPTQLVVHEEHGKLTQQQYGAVVHAYKLFSDVVHASPHKDGYHVQNRTLTDGTRVRMTSNTGVQTVHVWPVGGESEEEFIDILLGVPSSTTHRDGYTPSGAPGPSAQWRDYPNKPPPPSLQHVGTLTSHPGHVSWSSDKFKVKKRHVQLSWRGPGSRYSRSTGWSGAGGGTVVAHEDESYSIGPRSPTRTDSQYLWINGRRVDTGIQKVIAAALHRPDPENNPQRVILRVCTDQYPNPGNVRRLVVCDLVPSGLTALTSSLTAVLKATAFTVTSTDAAVNYKGDANPALVPADQDKWSHEQRPHFDDNGARLALILKEWDAAAWPVGQGSPGAIVYSIASLALPGFAVEQRVKFPRTNSFSDSMALTVNAASGDSGGDRDATGSQSGTFADEYSDVLAVDFKGDQLVHLRRRRVESRSYSGASLATWPTSGSQTASGEETRNFSIGIEVIHPQHGVLVSHAAGYSTTISGDSVDGSGTVTYSMGAEKNQAVSVVGDLSKDIFAIGWSAGTRLNALSGSGAGVMFATDSIQLSPSIGRPSTNPQLKYDVFVKGAKVAEQLAGTYAETWSLSVPPVFSPWAINAPCRAGELFNDLGESDSYSTTFISRVVDYQTVLLPTLPQVRYLHAAVEPRKRVGYLAVCHHHTALNVVVRDLAPGSGGSPTEVLPAYAPGDLATLSAPFFLENQPK